MKTKIKVLIIVTTVLVAGIWYYMDNRNIKVNVLFSNSLVTQCNVQGIAIHGDLKLYRTSKSDSYTYSDEIVRDIEEANRNVKIKGIILDVNSDGGNIVAGEEIMRAIANSSVPVVAVITGKAEGSSYLAISSSPKIFAENSSLIGNLNTHADYDTESIVGSSNFTSLEDSYNKISSTTDTNLKSLNKSMFTSFTNSILQNRRIQNISPTKLYTTRDAIQSRLVDEVGGLPEARSYLTRLIGGAVSDCW